MKITVSIVDDDERLRLRLRRMLGRFEDCDCISDHSTGQDAVTRIPDLQPDVVLMDINLPGLDGIGCVRQLKPWMSATEFIMLTVYEDSERIFQALAAGASGYLLKQAEIREIHDAIVLVNQGGAPMSCHIARKVVSAFRPTPAPASATFQNLSVRESEILDLLSKGLLYKEIAEQLKLTYNTVSNHVRHIYGKLHVNTRTEAVAVYLQQPGTPNRGVTGL